MTDEADVEAQMRLRSRSFDAWALEYDRYRPTYPQALFDHIAERLGLPADARVADLGAGTGKAARQMARRGWRVTAIEPGDGMLDVQRARAAAEGLEIDAHLASAEETGLPDQSVDLTTAAQAFHWFDKPRAVAEMARIVRAGGGVAVFWNARADERSTFLTEYTDLMTKFVPEDHIDRRGNAQVKPTTPADLEQGGFFTVDDKAILRHELEMSQDAFLGYVFTASYTRLFVDGEAQERLRSDLHALMAEHFGSGHVPVPYDVDVYVGKRI